jgi:hypothetical protein
VTRSSSPHEPTRGRRTLQPPAGLRVAARHDPPTGQGDGRPGGSWGHRASGARCGNSAGNVCSRKSRDAGGGARTPDTRIMIPLLFGSIEPKTGPGGHKRGHIRTPRASCRAWSRSPGRFIQAKPAVCWSVRRTGPGAGLDPFAGQRSTAPVYDAGLRRRVTGCRPGVDRPAQACGASTTWASTIYLNRGGSP